MFLKDGKAYYGTVYGDDFRTDLDQPDTWCDCRPDTLCMLFSASQADLKIDAQLFNLCRFLVDGKQPSIMGVRACTIMVCSPRNEVYKVRTRRGSKGVRTKMEMAPFHRQCRVGTCTRPCNLHLPV